MKKIAKYLFFAVVAALSFASCQEEYQDSRLNPTGTPVKFAFTATVTGALTADLKVVADTPVPADVTIAIGVDATSTWKEGLTFPAELVIAKGETEVTGKLTATTEGLAPGKYTAVLTASLAGVTLGTVNTVSADIPEPKSIEIDGNPAEWAKLPADYVTEMVCPQEAEFDGLKSAKVFYDDDALYVLLEVTDEALAQGVTDGKLRLHFFFDNGNDAQGGCYHKWSQPAIDYMLEGKMTSGGEWCALSSKYYKFTGEDPAAWGPWTAEEASPSFEFAGKGNYYECAMDYKSFPGGLKDVIGMGFDIQDGNYSILGYLPGEGPLAQVVKNGKEIPKPAEIEVKIDGDFSDWKAIETIPGDGAVTAMKIFKNETKMFFYLEINKNEDVKDSESMAFAHKIMLCFSADGYGEYGDAAWGGARYDTYVDIWLMQNGVPNMVTWGLDGFAHKETEADGVQKYEFCFDRSVKPIFSADDLFFGAFVNNQTVDTSTGTEVWDGDSFARIGSAPAVDQPMMMIGNPPIPEQPTITIDGDMSDWEDVTACATQDDGVIRVFKAAYDADYLYFYNKRTWHDGLWGGGYYYYEFDTDNNAATSVADVNGNTPCGGIDVWMYLYVFGGDSANPSFNANPEGDGYPSGDVISNVLVAGTTDGSTIIETETRIPRSNVGVKKGDIIRVWTWGNKSGSNLKHNPIPLRLAK